MAVTTGEKRSHVRYTPRARPGRDGAHCRTGEGLGDSSHWRHRVRRADPARLWRIASSGLWWLGGSGEGLERLAGCFGARSAWTSTELKISWLILASVMSPCSMVMWLPAGPLSSRPGRTVV